MLRPIGAWPQWDLAVQARASVAIWTRGTGEPTLLLHGFPDHAIGLIPLAEDLGAHGRQSIVVAYPGYWPSEAVPGGDYSLEAVSEDLLRVLDSLEIEAIDMVGHGWGAMFAFWIASHQPARVKRIVSIAAPHPRCLEPRRRLFAEQQTVVYAYLLAFAPEGRELAADSGWLTSLMSTFAPGLRRRDWPSVLELLTREGVSDEVCGYYRADMEGRGRPVGIVEAPTRIIYGAQSGCVRPAMFTGGEEFFSHGVESVAIPHAGHWPHLEAREETLGLILETLANPIERGGPPRGSGKRA